MFSHDWVPDSIRQKLRNLEEIKKSNKDVSPAVVNAEQTLLFIEEAVSKGKLKQSFTKSDLWKLEKKDADSKEAKRFDRDVVHLVMMGKLHLIKDMCPTCGHRLSDPHYALRSFKEQSYDFTQ